MNICSYCTFLFKCLFSSSVQASRLQTKPNSCLNSFHRGDALSGSRFCLAALQHAFQSRTENLCY